MIETEIQEESVEQALQRIRGVIKSIMTDKKTTSHEEQIAPKPNEEDVLELTENDIIEISNEEGSNNAANSGDVLKDIDNIISSEDSSNKTVAKEIKENIEVANKKEPASEKPPKAKAVAQEEAPSEAVNTVEDVATAATELSKAPPPPAIEIKEEPKAEIKPTIEQKVKNDAEITAPIQETPIIQEAMQDIKEESGLVSEASAQLSQDAIKSLIKTFEKPLSDGLSFRSGVTMEDLAIESMKPYLKEWLDNNLPSIVKHLVEKEIKKLIPDN